jgi:hypothetical protein
MRGLSPKNRLQEPTVLETSHFLMGYAGGRLFQQIMRWPVERHFPQGDNFAVAPELSTKTPPLSPSAKRPARPIGLCHAESHPHWHPREAAVWSALCPWPSTTLCSSHLGSQTGHCVYGLCMQNIPEQYQPLWLLHAASSPSIHVSLPCSATN